MAAESQAQRLPGSAHGTPGDDGAGAAAANIEAVARMEQGELDARTFVDRAGDAITGRMGTMTSIAVHVCVFVTWWAVNTGLVPGVPRFDPFPFGLLTMMVTMEAVLLTMFVLITQNRAGKRSTQRGHLNLQVDLLAEREMTEVLVLLKALCDREGIRVAGRGTEVRELMLPTDLDKLVAGLEEKLPRG